MRLFTILCCVLILGSCTGKCSRSHKAMSPEQVVEAYLNVALNMQSIEQREDLLKYTTGPLYEAVAMVGDDVIKRAYVDKNYQLESYSFLERRDRTPKEVEITFSLKFKELSETDRGEDGNLDFEKTPTVATENIVSVVKEKDLWKIRNVLNKKSSFDFPTSMAAEIEAKAGEVTVDSEGNPLK